MNNIEMRVNNLELGLQDLANFTGESQSKLASIIHTIASGISQEVQNQVRSEVVATKEQLKQEIKEDVTVIKQDVEKLNDALKETGIDRHKQTAIQNKLASRTFEFTGKKGTAKHTLFYSAVRGRLTKLLKQKYEISSYKDISIDEFDEAIKYIETLNVEGWFLDYILNNWKQKSDDGEIKVSEQRALDEYLKLKEM